MRSQIRWSWGYALPVLSTWVSLDADFFDLGAIGRAILLKGLVARHRRFAAPAAGRSRSTLYRMPGAGGQPAPAAARGGVVDKPAWGLLSRAPQLVYRQQLRAASRRRSGAWFGTVGFPAGQ